MIRQDILRFFLFFLHFYCPRNREGHTRRLDIQSKDDTQAAMGELKAEFFSALGTEHPELYRQLVAALERRQKGAQRGCNGMCCRS